MDVHRHGIMHHLKRKVDLRDELSGVIVVEESLLVRLLVHNIAVCVLHGPEPIVVANDS